MIKDYEKYRKKENIIIEYDVDWRRGHLFPVIFRENRRLMKGKILYLGCNNGTSLVCLSEYCKKLVGLDINEDALKVAERWIDDEGITNTELVHANICEMPFKDNSFDGIYAFSVIEHIFPEDQDKALSEIRRVLKKGKYLLVEFPTPTSGSYIHKQHVFNFKNEEFIKKHFSRYFKINKIIRETRRNPGRPSERHDSWIVKLKNTK